MIGRGARQWPLAGACFVALAGACGKNPIAPTEATPAVAFDSVWARYDRTYPYFGYKGVDWPALRAKYRPRAAAAATTADLANVVRDMLGELRDVHSGVIDPDGHTIPTYSPTAFRNWSAGPWNDQMTKNGITAMPGNWGYGLLGGLPYFYFSTWGSAALSLDAVDAALERFRDSSVIVIDVRMNGGGSDTPAFGVAGRFYDQSRAIGSVQYRSGPGHGDFTSPSLRTVGPRGPWRFKGRVLVLAGRATYSSAESFVMAMRVLPNVTIAGDTTGGGSGNPTTFALADGWRYSVPRWIEKLPDGNVVEWRGIPPAIVVPATAADFAAGRDPVLEWIPLWASGALRSAAAATRPTTRFDRESDGPQSG